MAQVHLAVDAPGVVPGRLDELTRSLFQDISAAGLVTVQRSSAAAPAGAKSGTATGIGELIVSGVLSAGTVSAIASVVIAWIKRTGVRKVVWTGPDGKTYEFTGLSANDQRELIAKLVADHTPGPAAGSASG